MARSEKPPNRVGISKYYFKIYVHYRSSLKTRFREVYPEYATQLEKAKSQEEVEQLQQKFLAEARTNLAQLLNKPVEALAASDQTAPLILTEQQYSFLVNATGDAIMNQLHVLLDGTARLQSMEKDNAAAVTARHRRETSANFWPGAAHLRHQPRGRWLVRCAHLRRVHALPPDLLATADG